MFHGDSATRRGSNVRPPDARRRLARYLVMTLIGMAAAALAASTAGAQEFSFTAYTQTAGLRNLGIEQLLVDRHGDMWLATDGGVYRYDGTTFIQYDKSRGIPADSSMAIAESPSGRIFARVDAGLFVGDADHFAPLLTTTGPVITDEYAVLVASGDERLLYVKNHRLMAAEHSGAAGSMWSTRALFSAAQTAAYPELTAIHGIVAVGAGRIWFGCGMRVCTLADDKLTVYGGSEGVPEAEYGTILSDRGGAIWARSLDHLVRLERAGEHFTVIDPPHVMLAARLRSLTLTLDPMGRIVTRTGQGLARWDGAAWQEFGPRNGLPDSPITGALADSDGNFWLAVSGIGLFRWDGYDNLESWTQRQGLAPEAVWNILRDGQHRLIFGTDLGCRTLDEPTLQVLPCPYRGIPESETGAGALDPAGALWVSFQNSQLWRVPLGSSQAQHVTSVPERFDVGSMLFDNAGTGWIAAMDYGVAKIDSRTLAVTRLQPPGNPRVDDVTQAPDGTIWVGTTNGLYRIENDRFVQIPTTVKGEHIGLQTVAAATDGSVWGTRTGEKLLHMASPHGAVSWDEPESLKGATIYALRADSRGWIWAPTGEGLGVYDGHVWRRIESQDGLTWADTNQFALYPDDDGSIWVGTGRGVTHIKDPIRWVQMISRPLKLDIARAQLGKQSLLAQPQLPWHDNAALDIAFGSRSFDRSPTTELRYRLVGLSTEWYASRTFDIHIPALAPGHYRLEAVAVDTPHQRRSADLSLSFVVTPPWWNTVVFRVVAAMLLAIALVALWRWQNQRMRERQRVLEREHREREALLERATRDALTGLWNRATILEFLIGEMDQARKNAGPLAVAIIDVDFFKRINDTFGHAGGDEVLKELARRLREMLRQRDSIGRYGGEELLVVMPGLSLDDRGSRMDELRESICSTLFNVDEAQQRVTVSIGVAWMNAAQDSSADLIRRADAALYDAKAAGRNRVVCSIHGAPALEATVSRRYLQDFIDRVKREGGKRGVEVD